jgi:nucleotide-binding universal stress UspA family protein
MNTVLLATDGSPTAAQALDFAIEMCQDTGARLEVLTVRTLAAHGDPQAPLGDHMDLQPVVEEVAAEAARHAHDLGVEASARTAYGSPAAMIAETAEALDADLVVVGSHGRSALARAALGSVSLGLVSSSCTVPVTVVRAVPAPASVAAGDKAQEA